jgi:hypothetical protein
MKNLRAAKPYGLPPALSRPQADERKQLNLKALLGLAEGATRFRHD